MTHPIITAAGLVDDALKAVADTNPTFMSTAEKSEALCELVRLESRVTELRLRVMADAADVAAETGARDVADWLAHRARLRPEDARADLRLAVALDRRRHAVGDALRAGDVTPSQAHVVVRALDDLPDCVGADVVEEAERALVRHAARFAPKQLARIGRHVLAVVAPQVADEAEAERLAAQEQEARRRTRVSLRRQGDGTTRLSALLPDAVAPRLAYYLEAYANPRRDDAPGSRCAGRATAPPACRPCSPTRSPPDSPTTSRPTPTRGATTLPLPAPARAPAPGRATAPATPAEKPAARPRTTRSIASPTPAAWARPSASCWRPSTRAGSRSTAVTRPRSWSPSTSMHCGPGSARATFSVAAPSRPTATTTRARAST